MNIPQARLQRLLPANWPIVVRLSAALLLAALLPMLIAGYASLRTSLERLKEAEIGNLQQLATTTAGRLDQFIRDTHHLLTYFAWSNEVIRLLGSKDPSSSERIAVVDKMDRLLAANEDIELLMTLDRQGRVVASSKPEYLNRDLSFREYFKEAIAGRDYRSHLEIGTRSGRSGLYLSAPVRAANGLVAGVAVMKMRGQAVVSIVDSARSSDRTAFLIDDDGVIIHHPDIQWIYHSLTPLKPDVQKIILDQRRFGDEPLPSINAPELAQAVGGLRGAGWAEFGGAGARPMQIAGLARLEMHNWVLSVAEPTSRFMRLLEPLYVDAMRNSVIVGAISIVLALIFARGFVGPIRQLVRAANDIKEGRYDEAPLMPTSADELGHLMTTFNDMVSGIRAHKRERDIFGRMVSPEVREKLLSGDLKLGGENRRVTVLFSDIRGFSTLSELMSPQDVVAFLNEYLTEMSAAVRPWGGYINNFIGDAIVVVFGAPEPLPEIEWCAVAAALDMKQRLALLNQR
ncbi:MAG TPA: cache domain-containing protein, partial [Rhodocyclaceae bacterium]|nr:cache domain-containing protein [Rhodocyclaceae bacterium]